MSIKARFTTRDNGFVVGTIEIDGVDISRRVTAIEFEGSPAGGYHLRLPLVVGLPGDEIEIEMDGAETPARAIVNGSVIEIEPIGADNALRLLAAIARK